MAAASGPQVASGRLLAVHGRQQTNVLWRWLGIRPVPHLPCSAECVATRSFAEALAEVGRHWEFATEIEWLDEILSWPVEWSALHGIAEIKTPVLKFSTRTDATASRFSVDWLGGGQALHGASGLAFPYRVGPAKHSASRAFQRGLAHAAEQSPDDV